MIKGVAAVAARGLRVDRRDLTWLGLVTAGFVVLFAGAAIPLPVLFTLGLMATVGAEFLDRRSRLTELMDAAQLGLFSRDLVRIIAIIVFGWRTGMAHFGWVVAVLVLFAVARAADLLVRQLLRQIRALPVETRNVDLTQLRIPNAPLSDLRLPVVFLLLTGTPNVPLLGVTLAAALALLGLFDIVRCLVRSRHLAQRSQILRRVMDTVLADSPEVVLYHSGPAGTAYQINMWLPVLAELDRRAIVILRQPLHLTELIPTSLPILCIPSGSDVMDLEMPTVKLALYVGNVGDNQHLIRNAAMRHVFVGHGDSDKTGSASRISKIYDEVWVAGPAGRDRYRAADVGVTDDAIVEVGRPQLASVASSGAGGPFTVLYAPTWEGWSDDMFVTSLPGMGVEIVTRLLEANVRVLYRPHPLTGTRNAAARAANEKIISLLGKPSSQPTREAAAVSARIAALSPPFAKYADGAQRARDSGPRPDAVAEIIAARAQLDDLFWQQRYPHASAVVTSTPGLYSCFNQSDLLISDLSSVVSDFAASGKPYVITNLADQPDAAFRAENTAARGAYLLGASRIADLSGILREVRPDGADPLARARSAARAYLLGPDHPDAVTRFRDAVDAGIQFARNTVAA
jgi:hypothetical protein